MSKPARQQEGTHHIDVCQVSFACEDKNFIIHNKNVGCNSGFHNGCFYSKSGCFLASFHRTGKVLIFGTLTSLQILTHFRRWRELSLFSQPLKPCLSRQELTEIDPGPSDRSSAQQFLLPSHSLTSQLFKHTTQTLNQEPGAVSCFVWVWTALWFTGLP